MRRALSVCGSIVMAVCVVASHAHAAPITWEFEATVRGTWGTPSSGDDALFQIGQVLSGSLTFDPSLPVGSAVTALHVEYLIGIDPYPPGPFVLGESASAGGIYVLDILSMDRVVFGSSLDPTTFDHTGGFGTSVTEVGLALLAAYPAAFLEGGQIPTVPPALSDLTPFDLAAFLNHAAPYTGLYLNSGDGSFNVGAELTSLRAVPEPALAVCALVALLALACFRRASRGSIAA